MTTPYYPQLEERDCGATCLRMVLAHHGLAVSMDRLRDLSGTDDRGTDLAGLACAAEALGFDTVAAELSFDELRAPDLWPAILHWDGDHFVVVTEVSEDRVHVLDPALGERRFDRENFERHRVGPGRSTAGLLVVPPSGAKQRLDTAIGPVASSSSTPPPVAWATALMYAGLVAAGEYVLVVVLRAAVDLQFHEAWRSNLGAMLLAMVALMLGRYLLRRALIQYASARGHHEAEALVARIKADVLQSGRAGNPTLALRLMEDIDTMRVWRAYRLATVFSASVTLLVTFVYAFSIDGSWALALLGSALGIGLVYFYYGVAESDVRQEALGAQIKQREGIVEYTQLLTETLRLRGSAAWSHERLRERNASAARAFGRISSEVIARSDIKLLFTGLGVIGLVTLALYQLGYGGLQVGDFLFLVLLVLLVFSQLHALSEAYRAYQRTGDARSRLGELRTERTPEPPLILQFDGDILRLRWRGPQDSPQAFDFKRSSRVALTGSDQSLRRVLIDACLGRENVVGAALSVASAEETRMSLTQLGGVAWLTEHSPLVVGTVADNIILDATADYARLDEVTRRLGLHDAGLPNGLATHTDERGSQLSHLTVVKTLVARALYAETASIVIDGLTDELPAYQEALIFDEILSSSAEKLVLCNARRQSATFGFELIVQLEAGEIEATGTHDVLVASGGAYALQIANEKALES